MDLLPQNYLRLTIQHGVKIDMTNYPGGKIIEPKKANVEHLRETIDGWKDGKIKWIKLTEEGLEQQKEILSNLELKIRTGNGNESRTMYNCVAVFGYPSAAD